MSLEGRGSGKESGQRKNVAFVPLQLAEVLSPRSTRRLSSWSSVVSCSCVRTGVDVTVAFQLSAVQCDCAAGSVLSARSSETATGHSSLLSTCRVAAGVTSGTFHECVFMYLSIESHVARGLSDGQRRSVLLRSVSLLNQ